MPQADQNNAACVVLVTCNQVKEAEAIAEAIVTERLAACVNIIGAQSPVQSFYIWEGKLQKDSEILLIIKTATVQLSALETRIRALHSYTTPEFIALPIQGGSADYLSWLAHNVG